MPDEIYEQNFFWRRTPAWHRKGHEIPEVATLKDAQRLAGHDFTVKLVDVTAGGILLDDRFGVQRTDTKAILGLVGSKYEVVQPDDVYDVIRPVIGENAGVLDCGGLLGNRGQKMWLLAKFPQEFYVPGVANDVIQNYLLILTSFDGSTKVVLRSTPVRVVCANTLDLAFRTLSPMQIEIAHLPGAQEQLKLAHRAMGLMTTHAEYLQETAGALAKIQMGATQVRNFLRKLLPSAPEERGEDAAAITLKKRDRIELLFLDLDRNNLPGMRGTAWALFNAVVEWADHERPTSERVDELNRLWMGATYDIKAEAARLLIKQLSGERVDAG
jgi:phage/plasmid-like protein (TIGR03299 family)